MGAWPPPSATAAGNHHTARPNSPRADSPGSAAARNRLADRPLPAHPSDRGDAPPGPAARVGAFERGSRRRAPLGSASRRILAPRGPRGRGPRRPSRTLKRRVKIGTARSRSRIGCRPDAPVGMLPREGAARRRHIRQLEARLQNTSDPAIRRSLERRSPVSGSRRPPPINPPRIIENQLRAPWKTRLSHS